jgi:C4-dicarboxylate-specific signal transduction histidine kinase
MRFIAGADRVLIEIEDECGGLADGNAEALFQPFERRNADRTGLGLGLAFSRWGADVNGCHISTRNLPGHGCVFGVELSRVPSPTLATA